MRSIQNDRDVVAETTIASVVIVVGEQVQGSGASRRLLGGTPTMVVE